MEGSKKEKNSDNNPYQGRVKIEIYGEELVEKIVKVSGKNGRIYLPINWIDRQVKIVRVD
jgi:hypothetical protein